MNLRSEYKKGKDLLLDELWNGIYTLVQPQYLKSLDGIADTIYKENIKGDIVECGVWKGGSCIYLAYSFLDRVIWAVDSYEGFQNLKDAKYSFENERHDDKFTAKHGKIYTRNNTIEISLEEVKDNFNKFGLSEKDGVNFVKGWVRDVLQPESCLIKNIALLRVDVDAYSATLEVLDYLYDKVSTGGYIVFDDFELVESRAAIMDFAKKRGLNFNFVHPCQASKQGTFIKKND